MIAQKPFKQFSRQF